MSDMCFWMCLKLLTEFDMMDLFNKIKCIGVNGILLKLIKSLLENKCQRVVLNGQTSSRESVLAGVLEGLILGFQSPYLHK